MKRLLPITLFVIAAAPFVLHSGMLQGAHDDCVHCEVACTRCGEQFCHPVPKEITYSRHCWEIECKQVCIPAVRFPWERWFGGGCDGCVDASCDACCRPRRGRTRWVRVLKKKKYDCKKCGCEWVVDPVCDDCLSTRPVDPAGPLHVDPVHVDPGLVPPDLPPLPDLDDAPRATPVTPVPAPVEGAWKKTTIRLNSLLLD